MAVLKLSTAATWCAVAICNNIHGRVDCVYRPGSEGRCILHFKMYKLYKYFVMICTWEYEHGVRFYCVQYILFALIISEEMAEVNAFDAAQISRCLAEELTCCLVCSLTGLSDMAIDINRILVGHHVILEGQWAAMFVECCCPICDSPTVKLLFI